jgi:hypothetical protein
MNNKNRNNNKKPNSNGNNKQAVKGKNNPRQDDGEQPIKDDRFSKLHFDPRFQKLPKNETKVKIDNRFSRMFTDKNFNDFTNIDRYGRGASTDQTSQLNKFYALDERAEQDAEQDAADVASEDEHEEAENKSAEHIDEDEEEEDEVREEGRIGLLSVQRDSDASSSSESSDDEDEALLESAEEEQEDVPLGDETTRLAVLNCDWDYMRAVDLLAVCQSFVPSQGSILHVHIYPSNLGLEQMAREQERGPDVFSEESDHEEQSISQSGSESAKKGKAVSVPKLRKREMSKLKYYFGVITCDSLATSRALYEALDGMEVEGSSQAMDLRYIPNEQNFEDRTATSTATPSDVPADYKPPTFGAGPVGHTKVDLTWDRTDPHRQRVMNEVWRVARDRNEKGYGVKESDFSAYLASSESSEEELSDEESKSTDKEKIRARYASLLSGFKNEGDESASSEGDMDMEVTFTSGLSELAEQMIEKKKRTEEDKDKTVWEQYLDKRREKKREHRKRKREDADEDEEREYDEADPFGDRDNEDEAPAKASKKKNKRKDKKKHAENSENKQREAELELLITDLKPRSEEDEGDERPHKKHKSNHPATDKTEFTLDPRFDRLASDPRFAIDPTNPQAKKTSAVGAINEVKAKQRQQSQVSAASAEQSERPLSSLVQSIKSKTQQHFNKPSHPTTKPQHPSKPHQSTKPRSHHAGPKPHSKHAPNKQH